MMTVAPNRPERLLSGDGYEAFERVVGEEMAHIGLAIVDL